MVFAGNQYNLNVTYTKTGANTYQMDYDIVDGVGASVFSTPPASQTLKFNADSGQMESINGGSPAPIKITNFPLFTASIIWGGNSGIGSIAIIRNYNYLIL